MKGEEDIQRRVGTENPFRVPEGYFEQLTSDVMQALPEKKTTSFTYHEPTTWEKIKPWAYMAAMFVGAALIIRIASSDRPVVADPVVSEDTDLELKEIARVMDCSMLDDYSMYLYLSGVEAETESYGGN